jgi:hypothetical protein
MFPSNHIRGIKSISLSIKEGRSLSNIDVTRALLTSELETIFSQAPPAPNSIAHRHIREAYARATGKSTAVETTDDDNDKKRRIPGPDDDCPICYESMHNIDVKLLTFCEECGNALHRECFKQCKCCRFLFSIFLTSIFFLLGAKTAAHNLTCVWCRAKWVTPGPSGGSSGQCRTTEDGYINLAGVAGISPIRDTSTCEKIFTSSTMHAHHY